MKNIKPFGWWIIISIFVFICAFVVCSSAQDGVVEEHYKKGKLYYEQGRYKEAKEEFRKALELAERLKTEDKTSQKPQQAEIEGAVTSDVRWEYTVGDEDVLEVSVWEWPDLSRDVIVRPDGKLSFPLIGDIQARGMTLSQLDDFITKELTNFIKNPQVSVSVKKIGGYKIIILGEVKTPGVYHLEQKAGGGLLEAIALAGGFTRDAVTRSVAVIKGGDIKNIKDPDITLVNVSEILREGATSRNITLESRDIIYVPRKFISDINYFLTQMFGPISTAAFTTGAVYNLQDRR